VVDSVRLAITISCSVLILVACGSGNLGRIADSLSARHPEAIGVKIELDAGAGANQTGKADASEGYCGDGIVQTSRGEQCDGSLGALSCGNLGLGAGELSCDPLACQVITSECSRDAGTVNPPLASAGAGGASGGGAGGRGGAGSAGAPAACPNNFVCRAPLRQGDQAVCTSWGEETGPVCFTPGPGVDCTPALPGSTCTATGLGMYCLLPCAP
jgi:hypothetical protein